MEDPPRPFEVRSNQLREFEDDVDRAADALAKDYHYFLNVSPDRLSLDRVLFVELCSGTGVMARTALAKGLCSEIMTVDCDEETRPTHLLDLTSASDVLRLHDILDRYRRDGHLIVMHASPPCNEWSRANTRSENRDRVTSLKLVDALFSDLLRPHAAFWSLENPDTGCLDRFHTAPEIELHRRARLSYCSYGLQCRKDTFLAFSLRGFCPRYFVAMRCAQEYGLTCPQTKLDVLSGRRVHLKLYRDYPGHGSVLPQALCDDLVDSIKAFLPELLTRIQRRMRELAGAAR
jgi:hypothetical protein